VAHRGRKDARNVARWVCEAYFEQRDIGEHRFEQRAGSAKVFWVARDVRERGFRHGARRLPSYAQAIQPSRDLVSVLIVRTLA
jgi:hypothetical protein